LNNFERLVAELERLVAKDPEAELEISSPLRPEGIWEVSINAIDGYAAVAEWKPHRGFGLYAGLDFEPFSGVDEIHDTWQVAAARMIELWKARGSTSVDLPVAFPELRKLRGHLQKDVAAVLGITKGGLAQIEASANEGKVQVDTLQKLVAAMGGRLVISAQFPDGTERKMAIGR
jgi:Helix-turn-helix